MSEKRRFAYYAVYKRTEDGWIYEIPDLKETGFPRDIDDARKMAREGVALGIKWKIEDGEEIPTPSTREELKKLVAEDPDVGDDWAIELIEVDLD
ncbi:MAG: type II toxin-antitoxin system HicB family antitoxin [Thermoguttaceae bacterium]|nr:type II toxin-antitoxin system HicB family antitoxin [Thermoguttaceae bacterium]